MLIIQDVIVSRDLLEKQFMCNLTACKGACCWEGDWGAPLEPEERQTLAAIYGDISSYLSPAGRTAIETQGPFAYYEEAEDYGTPLIDHGPCAYMTYGPGGVAQCGIEQAYNDGVTDFRKPVSCHLYPVRINKNEHFQALNYDRWEICSAACSLGAAQQMPVYRFVREALIRKYGTSFYEELDAAAAFLADDRETTAS